MLIGDEDESKQNSDIPVPQREGTAMFMDEDLTQKSGGVAQDTLRGKMRRGIYKGYKIIKAIYDYATELLIVHSGKLALLALFLVSISKPTLLNAGFFILFMAFSVSPYEKVKTFWIVPILFNCGAFLAIYAGDIFATQKAFESETLEIIGLGQKGNPYKYVPYLLLLGVLAVASHVFSSDRYKQFLECYALLEDKGVAGEQDEVPLVAQGLKQQLGLSDPLTKFITQTAIFWLIAAIFIECAFVPVSLLNFALLVFMSLIVITYLAANTQLEMY